MTRLLALYPDAWRARYGDEVEALLASRPPDLRDRLDIIRGAIDARLNPQHPGSPVHRPETADRVIGVLALATGALFTMWAALAVLYARPWGAATWKLEWWQEVALASAILGGLLGAVTVLSIVLRHGSRIGDLGVLGGLAVPLGLLLAVTGLFAALLVGYGSVLLARGMGGRVVSTAGATFFGSATLLAIAGLVVLGLSSGRDLWAIWLLVPYGPAWALLGFELVRRRAGSVAAPLA